MKLLSLMVFGALLSFKVWRLILKSVLLRHYLAPLAKYGVAIKNGFTLAADEINAKGGIKGNKITMVVEDEQGKKEEAINVIKKLIFQDKVLMVFGPTLSNSAFAADPIAVAAKVVVFGTSNTASGITDMGPYALETL
jgi:branched-chain amino acid transport system substrate-binding protein